MALYPRRHRARSSRITGRKYNNYRPAIRPSEICRHVRAHVATWRAIACRASAPHLTDSSRAGGAVRLGVDRPGKPQGRPSGRTQRDIGFLRAQPAPVRFRPRWRRWCQDEAAFVARTGPQLGTGNDMISLVSLVAPSVSSLRSRRPGHPLSLEGPQEGSH